MRASHRLAACLQEEPDALMSARPVRAGATSNGRPYRDRRWLRNRDQ